MYLFKYDYRSTNTSYFDTTPSNMNKSAREIQEKNVNLSYNTSFDIKETKMELINKVYSLRNNMKNINTSYYLKKKNFNVNLEMLNSSTKKNNQFDEINKLKNRRKDLEKQTQKLEKDMQKLTYKIKNNDKNDYELKNNEHLNNVVNNLKKEHEKTKIMFQAFRTEKFSEKINILLKKWRIINFKKFIEIMDNLKNFHENKISQVLKKIYYFIKKYF